MGKWATSHPFVDRKYLRPLARNSSTTQRHIVYRVSLERDFKLHKLGKHSQDLVIVQMQINGRKLNMEVDTGAALSVISEATRLTVFPKDTLHPSNLVLKTYTNERMEVIGTLNVRVVYRNQKRKLVLVVVAGDGPSLLGRKLAEVYTPRMDTNFCSVYCEWLDTLQL